MENNQNVKRERDACNASCSSGNLYYATHEDCVTIDSLIHWRLTALPTTQCHLRASHWFKRDTSQLLNASYSNTSLIRTILEQGVGCQMASVAVCLCSVTKHPAWILNFSRGAIVSKWAFLVHSNFSSRQIVRKKRYQHHTYYGRERT